ncbi:hypothetical protein AeMF1_011489 [Aphanomyces euteiches]|nr:hypothetical protein AeMF1_011489 [Aphanomyces euteiches]
MGKRVPLPTTTATPGLLPSILPKPDYWQLTHVEQLLREKILERTKIQDGKFIYQQAYRLLERHRGRGIDLPSFTHAIKTTLSVDLGDADIATLFHKYDVDGNGRIELYEFINRVLPQDYDTNVPSWIQTSIDRGDAQQLAIRQADRRTYENGRSFGEAYNPRRSLDDLRHDILVKLHQKIPKCIDRLRTAFKLLHTTGAPSMSKIDVRQSIRDVLGIALTEPQTNGLLDAFVIDGTDRVDVHAFLQRIFEADEVAPKEAGIFAADSEDDMRFHGGKRQIVPDRGIVQPQRFQKRVHGYWKTKHKNANPLRLQKPPPPRRRFTSKFQVPAVASAIPRRAATAAMDPPNAPSRKPRRLVWAKPLQLEDEMQQPMPPPSQHRPTPPKTTSKESAARPATHAVATTLASMSLEDDNAAYNGPRVAVSHRLQHSEAPYKANKPNWRVTENTFTAR